jgi:hypothetical protein
MATVIFGCHNIRLYKDGRNVGLMGKERDQRRILMGT